MKYYQKMIFVAFACLALLAGCSHASISGHISTSDQNRLKSSLERTLEAAKDDVSTIYYATKGLSYFKQQPSASTVKYICTKLASSWSETSTLEHTFYVVASWKQLSCSGNLNVRGIQQKVQSSLDDKASNADVYYITEVLQTLGQTQPDSQKLISILQARLKSDDSLQSFAYAFQTASKLGEKGQFAYDRIEDIVVQADEVDGKMLQFEGGLGITSLLLTGIARLTDSLKKPLPLTQVQVEKFANYLLSRRSVQSAKGVCCLLEATKAIISTSASPACISVVGSGQVTQEKPFLSVRVCDMLGNNLQLAAGAVLAQSATRLADDVVVLSKQRLTATSDPTVFSMELRHDPGRYRIALTTGTHSTSLFATVLGSVAVQWLEIGVADADQAAATKLQKVPYPSQLGTVLEADSQQRLLIKFSLGGRVVHQAFVRLQSHHTNKEVIFVAELDSSGVYKFDLDIGLKTNELGLRSGKYSIELIIGDAIISNPFRWNLAVVELKLGTASAPAVPQVVRGPKPDIQHMFREPEKRPSQVISTFFTGMVIAPLLLLVVLWFKLGANLSNFKFSLSAVVFHLGLAGIFGLFVVFWLKLDMFTTIRWLSLIGFVTFIAGQRLLSSIASQKKH